MRVFGLICIALALAGAAGLWWIASDAGSTESAEQPVSLTAPGRGGHSAAPRGRITDRDIPVSRDVTVIEQPATAKKEVGYDRLNRDLLAVAEALDRLNARLRGEAETRSSP